MSGRKDGGPAFPVEHLYDGMPWVNPGMSIRDWFAGQALVAQLGYPRDPQDGPLEPHHFAVMAYAIADAMLAERERTP